jgi:hypothetical protein
VEHVRREKFTNNFIEKLRENMRDLAVDEMIILKWILKKQCMMA